MHPEAAGRTTRLTDTGWVARVSVEHQQICLVCICAVVRPISDVGPNDEAVDATTRLLRPWHVEVRGARDGLAALDMRATCQ
jgi:hypothetical protein